MKVYVLISDGDDWAGPDASVHATLGGAVEAQRELVADYWQTCFAEKGDPRAMPDDVEDAIENLVEVDNYFHADIRECELEGVEDAEAVEVDGRAS